MPLYESLRLLPHSARSGVLGLRRNHNYAATMTLLLALGAGTSGAFFAFADPLVFRPLPYLQPDELVAIEGVNRRSGRTSATLSLRQLSVLDAADVGDESIATWTTPRLVTLGDSPSSSFELNAVPVSENFNEVLGIHPVIGRHFDEDDAHSPHKAAWLSYGLWHQLFGGASSVLGQSLTTDGGSFVVVGVIPKDYFFPSQMGFRADLIFASPPPVDDKERRFAIARLRPGSGLKATNAAVIAARSTSDDADESTTDLRLLPLREAIFQLKSPFVLLLFGASTLVLLAACLNVATLANTNIMSRLRDIAVRECLGASRATIVMDMLAEAAVIGCVGCLAALAVAGGISQFIVATVPTPMFSLVEVGLSGRVTMFVVAISLLAAVLSSGVPAVLASRRWHPFSGHSRPLLATGSIGRGLKILIGGQTACALLILVLCWVSVETFARLRISTLGFSGEGVGVVDLRVPSGLYEDPVAFWQVNQQILAGLNDRSMHVTAAGIDSLPMAGAMPELSYVPGPNLPRIGVYRISSRFFDVLEIPLLHGRTFTSEESSTNAPIAIVNLAAAKQLGSIESTVSKTLQVRDEATSRTIVGIVADIRPRFGANPAPAIYLPFNPTSFRRMTFVARSEPAPEIARRAAAIVSGIEPAFRTRTVALDEMVHRSVAQQRMQTLTLSVFSGLTMSLLTIGLYCTARSVTLARLTEIAIRLSYGATPSHIRSALIKQTMKPVAMGLIAGASIAWLAADSLSRWIPEIGAPSASVLAASAVWILLVSLWVAATASARMSRAVPLTLLRAS